MTNTNSFNERLFSNLYQRYKNFVYAGPLKKDALGFAKNVFLPQKPYQEEVDDHEQLQNTSYNSL